MNKSQKLYAEQKNLDTKKYLLYACIDVKLFLKNQLYSDRKQVSYCLGAEVVKGLTRKNTRKHFCVMEMFYILIVVVDTWVYIFVKTHQK